ncbi:hypothetical protein BV25DRAFT_1826740 [Artomyces pyxidatus]|uniref:Uncharacterized protein n=1 Tax=Artomyces pyxidatus TaxID=48021 RepID=A0ACB8SXQ5_9AGAM|nr:hypothetical protein BV25DRAFT_1826740 [Artomyces pyxidatus]
MAIITDFPMGVIDVIAGWIDSPDDALHLAVTSRVMANVLAPRHTQLRIIICPISSRCVWSLLANDVALARNVRVLWLTMNNGHFRTPTAFLERHPDCNHCGVQALNEAAQVKMKRDDERMLMAALKNMVNLTHFDWRHRQTNRITAACEPDGRDIWTALASCSNVTDLRLYEGGWCKIWGSAIFAMSNLTVFHYSTCYIDPPGRVDCTTLGVMLRERCPHLQDLRLEMYSDYSMEVYPPDIGPSILTGRWPDLSSLRLRVAACHSTHIIISFLEAHPGLRHLSIDNWVGCTTISDEPDEDELDRIPEPLSCTFPPGILPGLETLQCHAGQAIDILPSACSRPHGDSRIITHVIGDPANPLLRLAEFMSLAASLPNVEILHKARLEETLASTS